MKFFSSKKLFFVLLAVAFFCSIAVTAEMKVQEDQANLIISAKNPIFTNPETGKKTKEIIVSALSLKEKMEPAQAEKQLAAFDEQLSLIGENLQVFQKADAKQKEKIMMFLFMQITGIIDLRVSVTPIVQLGKKIMRNDVRTALLQTTKQTKKFKALVVTNMVMRKKYAAAKKLAQQLENTGHLVSGLLDDLERKSSL